MISTVTARLSSSDGWLRVISIGAPVVLVGLLYGFTVNSESLYFPPLPDVLERGREVWIWDGLVSEGLPSLRRVALGFLSGSFLGIVLGTLLGSVPRTRVAQPVLEFFRFVPPVTLIPISIILLGVGDLQKVTVITTATVWPVLLNTLDGIKHADSTLSDTCSAFGIRGWSKAIRVTIPSASPQIFSGLRTSLSLSIVVMVVAEMIASTNGIGYFVLYSQRTLAIADMWSGIIVLGIVGIGVNILFQIFESLALHWRKGDYLSGGTE